VLRQLEQLADPRVRAGMARFGIDATHAYGITMPQLRQLAKQIRREHDLALQLWTTGKHEARILACLIADPRLVGEERLEQWVREINSWDLCDQCCGALFDRTPFAYQKALEWSARTEEYVKRAGFVLMAELAVHDKRASDDQFLPFFPCMLREAHDDRNFVKKAINWALRQIGKRNRSLNQRAIAVAETLVQAEARSARWIGTDALRELQSEKVQQRLK
jgi:3-methyladenine DNA glycosylase AlkD